MDVKMKIGSNHSQDAFCLFRNAFSSEGRSCTGKTHLAMVVGIAACSQEVRTRFVTSCALANELIEACSENRLGPSHSVLYPLWS
jgi:hypothetical protein